MNRDALKTLAGLGIIALIVVATYLYGNSQREAQLRSQKTAQTSPSPATSASPKVAVSASPSATPTPVLGVTSGPKDGTMPQTGPELVTALAAGVMAVVGLAYWRSRRAVAVAQRTAR
jgi:lysozyme family protein